MRYDTDLYVIKGTKGQESHGSSPCSMALFFFLKMRILGQFTFFFILFASFLLAGPLPVNGATLAGSNSAAPGSVNLTSEGTGDWAHWGQTTASSFDHKAGVVSQISNVTAVGVAMQRFVGDPARSTGFSWSDGTPTASATGSTTGIYSFGVGTGVGNGYSITVPADTTVRTLHIYLGGWNSKSQVQATLSDGSALPYTLTIDTGAGNFVSWRVVTLTYSAASSGQKLTIRHTMLDGYSGGTIGLMAATQSLSSVSNGQLAGSNSAAPGSVNLTSEGTGDWAHWGQTTASSFDHKAGVVSQISNVTAVGVAMQRFVGDPARSTGFSWSDGTPTASATGSTTGIYSFGVGTGVGNGYSITVPADTTVRTLHIYLGGWNSKSQVQATLSDGSALPYTLTIDTGAGNFVSWRVVTLTYSAASSGQKLTIRHTMLDGYSGGTIGLMAATQSLSSVSNTAPVANAQSVSTNTDTALTITLSGSDADGNALTFAAAAPAHGALGVITNTTCTTTTPSTCTAKITYTPATGYSGADSFSFTANDSSLTSVPAAVNITVAATGGQLAGSNSAAPGSVNLTSEGTGDWAHWGQTTASSFDHKAGVVSQISNVTAVGVAMQRFVGDPARSTGFSWSDGTPTASATGSTTGIYSFGVGTGVGNGYSITVPADTTVRTLHIYLGGWNSKSQVQATLSDGSALPYTLTIDTGAGNFVSWRVVTLTYSAASSGQKLTIRHTMLDGYSGGTIGLMAATLAAGETTIPFADNFSDGSTQGWVAVDETGVVSNWTVINQQLYQTVRVMSFTSLDKSYHLGTYAYLQSGFGLTDYRFSVDATFIGTPGRLDDDIGVMFRYTDPDNYYRFSMNSRYGFSRLEKKVGGSFVPLAVDSRGFTIGQTMHITVDVRGSLIQVFLNSVPLFSVTDSSLPSGTIALYNEDQSRYDNVEIVSAGGVPAVTLSTPTAYSVQSNGTLSVSAVAAGVPVGGWVDLVLDGSSAVTDTTAPYSTQFTGLTTGDHTIQAILRDASGVELASDTNTVVGVFGDYYIGIGDSITNGDFDYFKLDNNSLSGRAFAVPGYEPLLTDLLDASQLKPNIAYNEGIGGDESVDTAFARVNSIVLRHPGANKVLLMSGTNDAGASIPSGSGCTGNACNGTYKGNMKAIINTLVGAGKEVWVALPPPVFGFSTPFANPDSATANTNFIQQYGNVVTNELSNRQVGPDFYAYFLGAGQNRFSLFTNTLHPNALGYKVMAQLWHNSLTLLNDPLPFVLDNLVPSTTAPYVKQNLLQTGNTYYVDATYTLTGIPASLNTGRWISTANSDKGNTSTNYLSFDVDRSVTVFIAYDAGATQLPTWMSGYANTGQSISTTDPLSPHYACIADPIRLDTWCSVVICKVQPAEPIRTILRLSSLTRTYRKNVHFTTHRHFASGVYPASGISSVAVTRRDSRRRGREYVFSGAFPGGYPDS